MLPYNTSTLGIFLLIVAFSVSQKNDAQENPENVVYESLSGKEKVSKGVQICESWAKSDEELLIFSKKLHAYALQNLLNTSYVLQTASCLANAYYYNDSLTQSTQILKDAIASTQLSSLEDTFYTGILLNDLGLNLNLFGQKEQAKANLKKAVAFLSGTDSLKELSDACINLGTVYHSEGQYQEAIHNFSKANNIDVQLNDSSRMSSSLNALGRIYVDWGKYNTAMDYYLQAVGCLDTLKDERTLSIRYNNIGMLYQKMEQYEDALLWFKKAFDIERQYGESNKLAIRYANMGHAQLKLNDFQKAKENLLKSIDIFKKGQSEHYLSKVFGILGQLYLETNRLDLAGQYLSRCLQLAANAGLPEQSGAYELMYKYHKKTGNNQEALMFLEKFKAAEDSIFNVEASNQIQRLEALYQSKQKEAEIVRLEAENELQVQTAAYNKRQRNAAMVVLAVFLIISLLLVWLFVTVRKQRERVKRQNQELDALNTTLKHLFGIISHDLRSASASYQSSAKIIEHYLDKDEPEKLKPLSAEIKKNASNLSNMLNHLLEWATMQISGLRPKTEQVDVAAEAESIYDLYRKQAGNKGIELKSNIDEGLLVHCDRESFRLILRNLVNNAIKFTKAGSIEISGTALADGKCELSIRDTGCGMPQSIRKTLFDLGNEKVRKGTAGEKGTGLGMILVAEHVRKNNAVIDVESDVGKGTTVRLTF